MLFSLVLAAVRADDAAADAMSGGGSDSSLQAELEQLKSKVSVLGLFRLILYLSALILSGCVICGVMRDPNGWCEFGCSIPVCGDGVCLRSNACSGNWRCVTGVGLVLLGFGLGCLRMKCW